MEPAGRVPASRRSRPSCAEKCCLLPAALRKAARRAEYVIWSVLSFISSPPQLPLTSPMRHLHINTGFFAQRSFFAGWEETLPQNEALKQGTVELIFAIQDCPLLEA